MRPESGSCHLENKLLLMDHHGKHKGKNRIIHTVVTQTPCWNLKVENFECPDFVSFPTLCFFVLIDLAKQRTKSELAAVKPFGHFEYIPVKPFLNSIMQY